MNWSLLWPNRYEIECMHGDNSGITILGLVISTYLRWTHSGY